MYYDQYNRTHISEYPDILNNYRLSLLEHYNI